MQLGDGKCETRRSQPWDPCQHLIDWSVVKIKLSGFLLDHPHERFSLNSSLDIGGKFALIDRRGSNVFFPARDQVA